MNMLLDPLSNSTCCASDGGTYNGMSALGDYGYGEGRGPTVRTVCVCMLSKLLATPLAKL